MYLKNLEIIGFKSFAERTSLKFCPGITVVVGPNGCGKSNIFDAIKWALGSQSPKSLRGVKMEDVIFNGTERHPPLNYAQAALLFSNEDGYLPLEYKEVEISRKLFRSGESEYYINKSLVRLKDVSDLFLGTGIGETTYSFVEQGTIEALLSYKPEEKRAIFDEASGIVKYKERKKETLRKLKQAEENLLRLDDVISEVKRQIRYLQRQVEKAKLYQKVNGELKEIEKLIAAAEISSLDEKTDKLLDELNAFEEEKKKKEILINELNSQISSLKGEIDSLRSRSEEIASEIITANSRIDSSFNHININQQRISELSQRINSLDSSKNDYEQKLSEKGSQIEQAEQEFSRLEEVYAGLESKKDEFSQEINRLKKEIEEAEVVINTEKKNIVNFEEQAVGFRNTLVEIQAQTQSLLARKKRLEIDKAKTEGEVTQKKDTYSQINEQLQQLNNKIKSLKERQLALLASLEELAKKTEGLKEEKLNKEKEIIGLRSYLEFLKELKIKYEQFPLTKDVTIVLEDKPEDISTLIISLKDTEWGYDEEKKCYRAKVKAKAIALDALQLEEKIKKLEEEIILLDNGIAQSISSKEKAQEELNSIEKDLTQANNDFSQKAQQKEIFDQEFARFKQELDVVEMELGEAVQEIAKLEEKTKAVEADLSSTEARLTESKDNLEKKQKDIVEFQNNLKEAEISFTKVQAEISSFSQRKDSLTLRINLLKEEKNSMDSALEDIARQRREAVGKIEELKGEIERLNTEINGMQDKVKSLTMQKEEVRTQEESLKAKEEGLEKDVSSASKELDKINNNAYNKKLQVQEMDFAKRKITDYLQQVYSMAITIEQLREVDTSSVDINQQKEQKEKLEKKLSSLGQVNLVAIEEFEELNKRYEFLETQKNDLIESKEDLKKAIAKINRVSREIFLDTFNKVAEEFKKNFRFLFGGGKARLMLLDESNVLESGVDIEVQPPGKKLQNVSLLSGGEKSLTAIALIFSIFKVKPSPLCVLDEIDAPLDEANVDRFNHLLCDFAKTSQFIVITHNKKTMSKADILYGVTMQERGISKVVSVKFEAASQQPA